MTSDTTDMGVGPRRIAATERGSDEWMFTRLERSDRVLDALRSFRRKRGYGPTVKELAFNAGLTASQTRTVLHDLREGGSVTWDHGVPGSLREVPDDEAGGGES